MKISEWRAKFRAFVLRYITNIGAWETERPQAITEVTAFMPPLSNIHYYLNQGLVMGTGQQSFAVVYRLPKTYKFDELPLSQYEGVHANFAIHLVQEYRDIADLLNLQLIAGQPLAVNEMGDAKSDWIITILWQMNISWYAEVEIPILPVYSITEVNARIRRGQTGNKGDVVTVTTPNVIDNTLNILRDL